ncbi:MAG TPA: Wzz/FepE/Etk N-terminal domain-containing protein [Phenylobacterium sp.]
MSIIQFLRILWARWLVIAACAVFTFIGGFVVTLAVAPRYEATSRVMLNILKPDVVTGEDAKLRNLGAYVETQGELLKDYTVTGPVVDQLGWLSDPRKIAEYQARPASETRDFRRWLSQQVADRTNAKLVSGTIFEISFSSNSPEEARVAADALRQSFLAYSLSSRRQDAARNAQWYSTQAEAARDLAEQAQLAKARYERENGIVMQGEQAGSQQDVDSARLAALVGQSATAPAAAMSAPLSMNSASSLQLAQIDAAIAQNADKLGPNHPQMKQLRAQRALVANVVAQEQAAARAGPSNTAAIAAIGHALEEQKARVIGQRDKIEHLRQLQSEVDLRREQYKKTAERAAELTLEAGVADPGMTSIGVVVTPTEPAFPNKRLIIIGSMGLGLGMGLVLAVLVELLNRRVRGVEDLAGDDDLHCLAVVASASPRRRSRFGKARRARSPVGAMA